MAACSSAVSPLAPVVSPSLVKAPARTTAWGRLVDDPSGRPLAGVAVHLAPWKRGCVKTSRHTASCPPYLRWHATTGADGRFVLRDVPNGEYLLVIGSDVPSDLERPTIHDRVAFAGGVQHLRAPTLPTIPCIGAAEIREWCQGAQPSPGITPFPRPKVEKSGDYRLTHVRPRQERPCAIAFNHRRAAAHLPTVVIDEWLTEWAREVNAYRISYRGLTPGPVPYITLEEGLMIGGHGCAEMVDLVPSKYFADPRLLWFSGTWYRLREGINRGATDGMVAFPIDPRVNAESAVGRWP